MSTTNENRSVEIVFCVLNGTSVLVCLLAIILVFGLRLYTKIVYRLAIYQVLSALAFSTVETLQIIFVNYDKSPVYQRLCTTIGWLVVYTQWMKLLLTVWLTVHLFCFGVLHKNLTKLEVLYIMSSLLVPAAIAVVPLLTDSYQINPLGCYIFTKNGTNDAAKIEWFALWNLPAIVILFIASITMVVIIMKLAYMVHLRQKIEPITERDQYWKALKQLIPLAAFPILFFFFTIPGFVYALYAAENSTANVSVMVAAVFLPMWSMASGITLLTHIAVARLYRKNRDQRRVNVYFSCHHTTERAVVAELTNNDTHYSFPKDDASM